MNKSIEEQIRICNEKINKDRELCANGVITRHIYSERCGLYCQEFYKEIIKIDKKIVIRQLLYHFDCISEETNWDLEDSLWIDCVSIVPDRVFVPYYRT